MAHPDHKILLPPGLRWPMVSPTGGGGRCHHAYVRGSEWGNLTWAAVWSGLPIWDDVLGHAERTAGFPLWVSVGEKGGVYLNQISNFFCLLLQRRLVEMVAWGS